LTTALFVSLVVGILVSTYFAVQANKALHQREAALMRARRFVEFLKENPASIQLKTDDLIQAFISENPDITEDQIRGALKGPYDGPMFGD
jgi:hypothetical protein